ncbi:MAG: enoyl-CoA hydratase/isomerase family protein [Candidatus Thalassarchaeaceae archaeon]|jgi:enoyl-CoA hydratase/carnithine racemase|nr:enoyl-CoA hydratase/isomerase family protein [Candidatus Thalassarchaeaceae archaeon]MDP6741676.1 enoyl-CoA hydratase/isomerase family protein [Candidatus Thalassarchaeaceae archaeon]MDP7043221.1 enoyl-CoA hydratase/isomerase family protein [Candidatus Thalassarchaeaceae archaeon]|tara:strand:+ start:1294 stop:2151 length:858 start_codon:yes stop_codon:yes gene_type:complete
MSSWPELEPMPNRLVNYGVTDNGIAIIELSSDSNGEPLEGDSKPVNTYTHGMMCDIDKAVVKARFDDNVSVILITGAGEGFFSAGASIAMLNSVTPGFKYNFCLHANETLSRLEQTSKLVIAALNGHAVGGGLEIAMAADIRIARKDAGKCGLPEINLGVLAGTGGTARLTRLIGKAKALEYMVSGELMAFEKAEELNLINHVWDGSAEQFRQDVLDWAGQYTLPYKATMAVGNIKRSCQSGPEMPFEYHLALERELQAALFNSKDAKEGIAAYVERRTPRFEGK